MIKGLLPYKSDNFPLIMEPKNTPKQKIEASVEAYPCPKCHYACMIGVKNEPMMINLRVT